MPKVLNAGHNGGVTENVFFHHVRTLEDLARQKQSIIGKERAQLKLAKEDGIDLKELKDVKRKRAMSIEAQMESYNTQRLYMQFFKMPIAAQMPAITEIKDEVGLTDDERSEKWFNDGYVCARRGGSRTENPHDDPNSIGARKWEAGYEKGQAENAKGIRKKAPEPEKAKPAETKPAAPATQPAKVTPKDEPEVAAAKRRGRPAKGGVTYWHNPTLKKVYELTVADAQPEGAVPITRPEAEKLQAEYEAAEKAEWEEAEKLAAAGQPADGEEKPADFKDDFDDEPTEETVGDDDGDPGDDDGDTPPTPPMTLN